MNIIREKEEQEEEQEEDGRSRGPVIAGCGVGPRRGLHGEPTRAAVADASRCVSARGAPRSACVPSPCAEGPPARGRLIAAPTAHVDARTRRGGGTREGGVLFGPCRAARLGHPRASPQLCWPGRAARGALSSHADAPRLNPAARGDRLGSRSSRLMRGDGALRACSV